MLTNELTAHPKCHGRLSNHVRIDGKWSADPRPVLAKAVA